MSGISIIICCYNSAKRLPETLAHIAHQKIADATQWELIIVNNNSSDNTEFAAQELWQSLGEPCPLKITFEPQPGLSYARENGMKAAEYDIMLWCDDDNWLCDTYVQTALDVISDNKEIGALGGWCEAAFESNKPEWFDANARYFAVSKQGKRTGDITFKKGCVYGAGMVLRKEHWQQLKSLGFSHLLKDRVGASLSSGGDTEYCYALRLLGYKIWYDDRLFFKHFMADGRLSLDYVSRIRKAMRYSNFMLWPYLDILKGHIRDRKDFYKEAKKGMPILPLRKAVTLVVGSFEQKEDAKRYFSTLKHRFFNYQSYQRNLDIIKSWKP